MYIQGHEDEYRSFLAQNESFWRESSRHTGPTDGAIYVDLTHDHPAYLATNLWVAKYVQRVRGGRLIGLAHAWVRACPHYNLDRIRELADSFLVEEVVDLDSTGADDVQTSARFESNLRGLSGHELRQAVLGFDADRDPDLGWILYDTWLRQERRGTFDNPEAGLFECARSVFRVRRSVSDAMRNRKASAAIVGHYHYAPYAFIAFEAARQGAPVYFQSLLIPVNIRRFNSAGDIRRGRPADFRNTYERIAGHIASPQLAGFEKRMFDVQRGAREFFRAAADGAGASRHEFLTGDRLDPTIPVVCFYVPALCGAPHCFGPVPFDDLGDWLRRSLDIARRIAHVNFLVKRHPQDAVYDTTNLVGELETVYGSAPNIRFVRGDVSASAMASLCDVIVTVSGTPGYDMAVRGVPTIAAGPSRYSSLGFAREPADLDEYERLLASAGQYKLDADRRRRALMFAYFELALGRSTSLFLPPLRSAGTAEFWQEAERYLRSRFVEEDPLYRNVRYMLEHDLPFLVNVDLLDQTVRLR